MNCGRSSSVEWKLPKLQRRVRFPSPAPPPARPRAGRFCYSCAGCANNGDTANQQHTREPRAHTNGCGTAQRGIAQHEGPTRRRQVVGRLRGVLPPLPKWRTPRHLRGLGAAPVGAKNLAQYGPSSNSSVKKLAQQEPGHLVFGTKFAQLARNAAFSHILRVQGELCLVFDDSKPSRANFVSLTPTSLRAGRTFSRRLIETAEHGAFSLTLGMTTSQD